MTSMTVLAVFQRTSSSGSQFVAGFTVSHDSGNADTSLVFVSADVPSIGGRRVQADSFQNCVGASISNNVPIMLGGVMDYTNAKISLHQGGKPQVLSQTFQSGGSTSAVAPRAVAVGGLAAETGTSASSFFDGYLGEWWVYKNRVLTPDQMCVRAAYLATKWNPTPPVF
jgi:hypothetical protein